MVYAQDIEQWKICKEQSETCGWEGEAAMCGKHYDKRLTNMWSIVSSIAHQHILKSQSGPCVSQVGSVCGRGCCVGRSLQLWSCSSSAGAPQRLAGFALPLSCQQSLWRLISTTSRYRIMKEEREEGKFYLIILFLTDAVFTKKERTSTERDI